MSDVKGTLQEGVIDKSAVFNKKVLEKVKEVQNLCNAHKIPFFMTFGIGTDEEGRFITEKMFSILPEMLSDQMVKDHRFADLINLESGNFVAVLKDPQDEAMTPDLEFSNKDEMDELLPPR